MDLPSSRAYLSVFWGVVVVVVVVGVMAVSAGSRKGREPVGEAWFVEGRRWNLTPAIRRKVYHIGLVSSKTPKWSWYFGGDARGQRVGKQRQGSEWPVCGAPRQLAVARIGETRRLRSSRLTCHLRHEGLKLGAPRSASWSVMKTCRVGRSEGPGER